MIALSFIVYYSHINQSYISLAVIVGQWLHEIHQFTIMKVVTNILYRQTISEQILAGKLGRKMLYLQK